MSSSKAFIIGSAAAVLVATVFVATMRQSPERREKSAMTEARPISRRVAEPAVVRGVNRPRAAVDSMPDDLRRDFEMQAKGYNAAGEGLESVVAGLGELKDEHERESFLRGAFTCAAGLGIPEALKWAWQIPQGEARDAALLTLFGKWSGKTTVEVIGECDPSDGGIAGALGTFLLKNHRATPEQVAAFAYDFVLGPRRVSLIADAAVVLSATDPARAFALGDALSGDAIFLERFATGWAAHDPQAVWRWAGQIPDLDSRQEMQAIAVSAMGKLNPAKAAGYLQEMQVQGELRATLIEKLGARWAVEDAKAAQQWAETFPDATDRANAQKGIRVSAPVGIGVGLGEDSNNGFVVNHVMPGSPASGAGGLVLGDRIVAVNDADGKWVYGSNLKLTEFIPHVRGESNTKVVLQVQGKDGGPPRTVTIIRRQLLVQNP